MRHCTHMQQHFYGSHSASRRWHELQCKRCRTSVSMAVNVVKTPGVFSKRMEVQGIGSPQLPGRPRQLPVSSLSLCNTQYALPNTPSVPCCLCNRYLGSYPELWGVPYSKVRQAIFDHPTLLADCGILREDFKPEGKTSRIHLHHIIPQSLGGPYHALNLVLMKDSRNHYFGADLTAEKAQEVGPQTMLAAHEFYVHFYMRKAALGPGVHQALLQQLQPFGSLRARAVPLLAGSMNSSW